MGFRWALTKKRYSRHSLFDGHRLQALLLNASELQLHPRTGNLPEPEGAGDTVDNPSSEEEYSTTKRMLILKYHRMKSLGFFPSDASWLSPGRSTRSIACCSDE